MIAHMACRVFLLKKILLNFLLLKGSGIFPDIKPGFIQLVYIRFNLEMHFTSQFRLFHGFNITLLRADESILPLEGSKSSGLTNMERTGDPRSIMASRR
jgi:hypothetical protein